SHRSWRPRPPAWYWSEPCRLLAPDPHRPVGAERREAVKRVNARHFLIRRRRVLPHIPQGQTQLVVGHACRFRARQIAIEVGRGKDERLGMEEWRVGGLGRG